MKRSPKNTEQTMNLKESNQFLAEVLYSDGIDIYKAPKSKLRELMPTIANTRKRIDEILREHFRVSFSELDLLPEQELQKIRESFLGIYRGSIENAEKLKKWLPLNQLVGYSEVLVSSAYLNFNAQIDSCLEKIDENDLDNKHLRLKILNAFKKINQGKRWDEIEQEVNDYLNQNGMEDGKDLFDKWKESFEQINHPLQELYASHLETMDVNQNIQDLQFTEKKRSKIIQSLIGKTRRNWKPADLEHDIHAQSAEANRSIIELACNAIDANKEGEKGVEITLGPKGYSVKDHGQGMNPYVILEKLMIPKVSGKSGKETIGRFGVGFYTVLSHLKHKDDFIRLETGNGQEGYIIEFKIHEKTSDIFIHTEKAKTPEKGTTITVSAKDFDAPNAEALCKNLLGHNNQDEILLNGEKINSSEGFENIKGEKTELKYSKEISNEAKISLMVNGVVIETFETSGANLCKELAVDLPLECSLPESRSELAIDGVAISSIKEVIDRIFQTEMEENQKIAILNSLYPILEKLQARSRYNKKSDNLPAYLQDKFKAELAKDKPIFLPNDIAFLALKVPGAMHLNSKIFSTDFEKIPGIGKCLDFKSENGYQLFIADFIPEQEEFIIEDEKRIVLSREIYEKHKDSPAGLNVYFSNLDSTRQSRKEKNRGRIEQEDLQRTNSSPDRELEILDERDLLVIGIIKALDMEVNEEDLADFMRLPEDQKVELIKKRTLSSIEDGLNMAAGGKKAAKSKARYSQAEKESILNQARQVIDANKDISTLRKELFDHFETNDESVELPNFWCQEEYNYIWLKYFKLNGNEKIFGLFKEYDDFKTKKARELGYPTVSNYHKRDYVGKLVLLGNYMPLEELEQFFSEYDKTYFFAYLDLMNELLLDSPYRFNPIRKTKWPMAKGITEECLARADEIFRKKLLNLSVEEIYKFQESIREAKFFTHNYHVDVDFTKADYHCVQRSMRGYLMYILEGGEILSEKKYEDETVKLPSYQAQITLSTLVQAKKDDENYFQDFSGKPSELFSHANTLQKGVDSSKAMREIMHSTKNQIVNDGYLWIREIMQNSLDAIGQDRKNSSETPKVEIDAYLRREAKEVPENRLWYIFEEVIAKEYPDHVNYFIRILKNSYPKLTLENFLDAADHLGAQESRGQKFFNKTLIEALKLDFETNILSALSLIVEAKDPVGMDLNTIVNYLLIPNESSKKYDEETVGKFGQGFFTIFGDAQEVLIKTSVGNGTVEYLCVKPIKDNEGNIIDFSVEISEREEEFKGTIIQKVVETDMPQVEAAFCKSAAMSYCGLVDRQIVALDFRGKEINSPRKVLAESHIQGLGPIRIYDANENAITQNGLFVRELDGELLDNLPQNIRQAMEKTGFALDISPSIKLIKSRSDIAKKKEVLPILKKQLPTILIRAYLASVMNNKTDLLNVPYDFFENPSRININKKIAEDAKKIAAGESLDNYDKYIKSENDLIQLLSALPCINLGQRQISIIELAVEFENNPDGIEIELLPKRIQEMIKVAADSKVRKTQNQEQAKQEFGAEGTIVMNDKDLPKSEKIKEEASLYYAYDHLIRYILEHVGAKEVKPKYYYEIGQSNAHARQNSLQIGFNLTYIEQLMPEFKEIMENKLPANNKRVQNFLEEAIRLCTHERQHNLENSQEGEWTHNDTFFAGQRKILSQFIKDAGVDFQALLDQLYTGFKPAFLPAKEMLKQMK